MDFSVIILAAGAGTRMRSTQPKVLHKICGKSMIDLILDSALKASDDVHVILYHQKDIIQHHITEIFGTRQITIHTQDHQKYPGTGGALLDSSGTMIETKHQRVVILNGDMPLIQSQTIQAIANIDAKAVLSIIQMPNPQGYGRVIFCRF